MRKLVKDRPVTTQIYLHVTQKKLMTVARPIDTLLNDEEKEQKITDNVNEKLPLSGEFNI